MQVAVMDSPFVAHSSYVHVNGAPQPMSHAIPSGGGSGGQAGAPPPPMQGPGTTLHAPPEQVATVSPQQGTA